MENTQRKSCKSADCNVSKDEICVEGMKLAECPHFYWEDGDEEESGQDAGENEIQPQLFSGKEFSLDELSFITNRHYCTLVILIGESGCGKTTLLATLFDLLQMGPFAGYHYGGSLTQVGFEVRCHMSRSASNRTIPNTAKSTSGSFEFLHIALKKSYDDEQMHHLLLSDIAGEKFRDATSSSSRMEELTLLKDVRELILIIDGENLAAVRKRSSAIFYAEQFIQRALDSGIFNKETNLKIVVSKFDVLKMDKTFDYDNEIQKHFTTRFSIFLKGLKFAKIAVRPDSPDHQLKLGNGLKELLDEWTTEQMPAPIEAFEPERRFIGRYFDLFSYQF